MKLRGFNSCIDFQLQDYQSEDYGQTATYLGTIKTSPSLFWLDLNHAFEVGRPERVCANTAAMLSKTR